MGRGVSTPRGALLGVFIDISEYDSDTWDEFVDDIRMIGREKYPSLQDDDRWVGREDRCIASNRWVMVCLSTYGNVACISLVPVENHGIGQGWAHRFCHHWKKYMQSRYSTYRRIGVASNGESFYEKVGA